MSRCTQALRALSDRLDLPQPARSRILVEVAGDLEALFESLREEGLSEEDAKREALTQIDLSDEAIEALCRVHGGWFRRFANNLAQRGGGGWERALLALLILGSVVLSGGLLRAIPMASVAGAWFLPVGGVALAGTAVAVWKAYVLILIGDHRPVRMRRGLDAILGLSVLQIFLAFVGLWVTAIASVRAMSDDPLEAGQVTMHWLQSSLALLIPSLSLALLGGLVWFSLLSRIVSIEHKEAAALLAGSSSRG